MVRVSFPGVEPGLLINGPNLGEGGSKLQVEPIFFTQGVDTALTGVENDDLIVE